MVARVRLRRVLRGAVIAAMATLAFATPARAQACGGFRVLVFSKTAGFRHGQQIVAGLALIRRLGSAQGFAVDATEDATQFNATNLEQYAAVVFLNTTGDVLNATQQAAFEAYSRAGGGWVGIHSAADTEYGWPYYGALMGAYFQSHPAVQPADLVVANPNHPSTANLLSRFSHTDEWYDYRTNPANDPELTVLLTVDEATYSGGNMGKVHPIAWFRDVPGAGRSWYTGLGHTVSTYTQAFFEQHLLGGILFAAGSLRRPTIAGFQSYGSASGAPPLTLAGRPASPALSELMLSGATPSANGALLLSTCSAAISLPPWRILVEVAPQHYVGAVPVIFDATGRSLLPLPNRLAVPAWVGISLFFQGAQLAPTVGFSNGLHVALRP